MLLFFILLFFYSFMFVNMSERDEHRTKHGEHKCLNEAYQYFKKHHKDAHQDTDNSHRSSSNSIDTKHDKDDARQREGNGVTSHHIGKKSNHQSQWLGEDAEKFYEWH